MAISLLKDPDARNDPPRPLLEHLLALRDMLVFGAVAWAICAVVAGCCTPWILEWLKSPAGESEELLQGLDLTTGVSTIISIAGWGGTALAFPFIMYAILRFIFPALTNREKVVLMSILVAGSGFFLVGLGVAYAKTLPMVVRAFRAINEWCGIPSTIIRLEGYISIVLKTIIAFGLVFQIPLLLFVLGWFGIITSQTLRNTRRWAIVIIFTLAMVLTPPDPMSQIIMAIPLCLMYEAAVWAVWVKERLSRRR